MCNGSDSPTVATSLENAQNHRSIVILESRLYEVLARLSVIGLAPAEQETQKHLLVRGDALRRLLQLELDDVCGGDAADAGHVARPLCFPRPLAHGYLFLEKGQRCCARFKGTLFYDGSALFELVRREWQRVRIRRWRARALALALFFVVRSAHHDGGAVGEGG